MWLSLTAWAFQFVASSHMFFFQFQTTYQGMRQDGRKVIHKVRNGCADARRVWLKSKWVNIAKSKLWGSLLQLLPCDIFRPSLAAVAAGCVYFPWLLRSTHKRNSPATWKAQRIIYGDVRQRAAAQASDTCQRSRFCTSAQKPLVGSSVRGSWLPVDFLVIKRHLLLPLAYGLSITNPN